MKQYKDITGTSGVTAYEENSNSISIEFNHEAVYLYTYSSAGKRAIEKMKNSPKPAKGLVPI